MDLVLARQVAEKLKTLKVVGLYSSPVLRARQTAHLIGTSVGLAPTSIEEFTELGMGPWAGLSEMQVAKAFPAEWSIWNQTPADLVLPGRERLQDVLERILAGLRRISATGESGGIRVVVTHVAVIRVLRLYASSLNLNLYKQIVVPNAEPLRMHLDDHSFLETH